MEKSPFRREEHAAKKRARHKGMLARLVNNLTQDFHATTTTQASSAQLSRRSFSFFLGDDMLQHRLLMFRGYT